MKENFYGNLRESVITDIINESPHKERGKYIELFFKNPITVGSFRDHFKNYCSDKSGLNCPASYGIYPPNFLLFAAHLQYDVQFIANFGSITTHKKNKLGFPQWVGKIEILILPMSPKYIYHVDDIKRGIEDVPESDPLGMATRNFLNNIDEIIQHYIIYKLGGTFERGAKKIVLDKR